LRRPRLYQSCSAKQEEEEEEEDDDDDALISQFYFGMKQ